MGCSVPEAVERPGGPLGIKAVADVVIWEGTLTTKAGVAAPAFDVVVVGPSLSLLLLFADFFSVFFKIIVPKPFLFLHLAFT